MTAQPIDLAAPVWLRNGPGVAPIAPIALLDGPALAAPLFRPDVSGWS